MLSTLMPRRAARALAAAAALSFAAACNDSTGPDEHADEVSAIRLTIAQGGTTRTVTYTQGQMPAALPLFVGTSTVTAQFLADDGDVITDLDADDHTLSIESIAPASAFTFTRTGAFAATVNAPAAGTATATVCLTHDSHCDLEFQNVPVTIAN